MHDRLTYTGFEPAHTLWVKVNQGGKSCGIKRQAAPACTIRRRPCNTFRKQLRARRRVFGQRDQARNHKGPFGTSDITGISLSFYTYSIAAAAQSA
jgi:hypothetical protein